MLCYIGIASVVIVYTQALRPWYFSVNDCDECTSNFCIEKGASDKWGECFQPKRDEFICRCYPGIDIPVDCDSLDYINCTTYQASCYYVFLEKRCMSRSVYIQNKVEMCKSRRRKKNCNKTRGCHWKRTNSTCLFK